MGGSSHGTGPSPPSPGLKKWWGVHTHHDGLVKEHISPYQQRILTPLLYQWKHKVHHRALNIAPWVVGFSVLYGIRAWAQHHEHEEHKSHWP